MYTKGYFPRVAMLVDITPPSHKVNWSGLEGIPLLSFQLGALTEISFDISPSHLLEREWHQLRVRTEMFLHACRYWMQNSPTPVWYLLKGDSYSFCPLLSFSFPSQTGFKRLRRDELWWAWSSNKTWCFKRADTGGIHPLCKLHLGCLPSQFILIVRGYEKQ